MKRYSFEQVQLIFESNGCQLLSTEYVNNYSSLEYQCSCKNISRTTLKRFLNGHRCRSCASIKISNYQKLRKRPVSKKPTIVSTKPSKKVVKKRPIKSARVPTPTHTCVTCGAIFSRRKSQFRHRRTANKFCSRSCSATYNNRNKTHGTRRSKLEIWLEQELSKLYPNLEIHYNRKDAINAELDIYIPSLKLAFELNGIFHYEPVFGQDKLDQIQSNDCRKFQACVGAGIGLCVIDTSSMKNFKPVKARRYLQIITDIVTPVLGKQY